MRAGLPVIVALASAALFAAAPIAYRQSPIAHALPALDKAGEAWVDRTLAHLSLEEKVGQLIMTAADSTYLATDTDAFDQLAARVRGLHVGGLLLFGGAEPAPDVLLDPHYGTVTLGQPLAAASLVNRLQQAAEVPLLVASDFEAGAGFRIQGATVFPRAMAFGAAGDEQLTYEAARLTAVEARALGVGLDFSPIADVNDDPRNPVINVRSFGERPDAVGRMVAAYVRGLHAGGMLATLKHFPGHGDTDVDSHLGLPIIPKPRAALDTTELPPFRAGLAAGADAVMTGHIELPALDDGAFSPASLSAPIVTGLLRGELGFDGLVCTDSLGMDAVARALSPGDAAVRAVEAGNDLVVHSPDEAAAAAAITAAVERGEIPMARLDASVRRILIAKARLGLDREKLVPLDAVPAAVGGRAHAAVAQQASQRAITLIKDARGDVPLHVSRDAAVLYVSVLDYPSGWRIAAPSRTMLPELRARWTHVTAVEVSDQTTPADLDFIRATAGRYDAIVAGVFVRAASESGRMDLAPAVAAFLNALGRAASSAQKPMVAALFGNPYVSTGLPDVPAMLLTYDFYDLAEASAVRALAGEVPIAGRLPITLPGLGDVGFGLMRPIGR